MDSEKVKAIVDWRAPTIIKQVQRFLGFANFYRRFISNYSARVPPIIDLEYISESKRLNPRQARWALFFSRFNFVVTYHPGSNNGKADALSRLHTSEAEPAAPDPIIPVLHLQRPHQVEAEPFVGRDCPQPTHGYLSL